MRYHFFLHYGWFFQNLRKEAVRTFMHTTVCDLTKDSCRDQLPPWKSISGARNFVNIVNKIKIWQERKNVKRLNLELHFVIWRKKSCIDQISLPPPAPRFRRPRWASIDPYINMQITQISMGMTVRIEIAKCKRHICILKNSFSFSTKCIIQWPYRAVGTGGQGGRLPPPP